MKLIRWMLGRIIISLDIIFSPKPMIRDNVLQTKINKITTDYKLYQYNACPFCVKVRRFFKRESLSIDLVDAKQESFKQELIHNGGKQKVPCLKVELKNKSVRWIYESNDIIEFISKEIKLR